MPSDSAHITPQSLLGPTLKAWEVFLEDQGSSPHTIKAFIADLRLLSGYLPSDRPLGKITTTDLNNFLDWMQTHRGVPCSPKTLSRRITAIKSFFRWLTQNGVLVIDPSEKVLQKAAISPLPVVLTPEELQAVMEAAEFHRRAAKPDTRPLALVTLLFATAVKKGELLGIALNHLDFEAEGGPTLFVRYPSHQYRYKERKLPLPENWLPIYEEYKAQYGLTEQLFPWSARRLEYLLEDLGEEAGLSKHLSFDMFRWTSVLNDWQSGMERNKIRQKLGISKIQWREIQLKLAQLSGEELESEPTTT